MDRLPTAPALHISTTKIYKFRPFEVTILLPKEWLDRQLVTPEQVLTAGIGAKCVAENSPTEVLGPCPKCKSKKKSLISIKASSKGTFGPHPVSLSVVKFVFNACRSHCTSSRDHLRSRILLAVELRGVVLRSPPLVLRSREKGYQGMPIAAAGTAQQQLLMQRAAQEMLFGPGAQAQVPGQVQVSQVASAAGGAMSSSGSPSPSPSLGSPEGIGVPRPMSAEIQMQAMQMQALQMQMQMAQAQAAQGAVLLQQQTAALQLQQMRTAQAQAQVQAAAAAIAQAQQQQAQAQPPMLTPPGFLSSTRAAGGVLVDSAASLQQQRAALMQAQPGVGLFVSASPVNQLSVSQASPIAALGLAAAASAAAAAPQVFPALDVSASSSASATTGTPDRRSLPSIDAILGVLQHSKDPSSPVEQQPGARLFLPRVTAI